MVGPWAWVGMTLPLHSVREPAEHAAAHTQVLCKETSGVQGDIWRQDPSGSDLSPVNSTCVTSWTPQSCRKCKGASELGKSDEKSVGKGPEQE